MVEVSKEEVDAYEKEHKQRVDMLLIMYNLLNTMKNLNNAGNYGWDLNNIQKQYETSWMAEMKIATYKIYHYNWNEKKYEKMEVQN